VSYTKKPSVVRIDPTVTHLQPDQFDNDDPIQDYPFGTSAMRVTTATGFPETSGDVITSRTTDDTGSQIFIGEKAYIRAFEGSVWSSWRELGESGGGGPVEWDDIINKPSQFPPSPHTHDIEDIIGLQAALDDKAPAQSVNELQQEVDEHKADIMSQEVGKGADMIGLPDPNGLFTATTVRGALEELFTSVSDGKNLIGGAITDVDPSIIIPPNPTFQQLGDAIRQISTGQKWASGETRSGTTPITFTVWDGTTRTERALEVNVSFGFQPSTIVAFARNPINTERITIVFPTNLEYRPNARILFANTLGSGGSGNTIWLYQLDGVSAYVTQNGFRIPASSDFQYVWWAFE